MSADKCRQQIDGLGSGISSLSKVCIVSPSTHPSADIDYTFAAVGITSPEVDFSGNCGNMLSAIGPFAYNAGLIPQTNQPNTTIRIHNTNTNKLIHSTFSLTADRNSAATAGDYTISGVPVPGSKITLSFLSPLAPRQVSSSQPETSSTPSPASKRVASTPLLRVYSSALQTSVSTAPNSRS